MLTTSSAAVLRDGMEKLETEGDTRQILAFLHAEGINVRGHCRGSADFCPLAQWFTRLLGVHVRVTRSAVWVYARGIYNMPLTPKLADLVAAFDRGYMP